MQAPKLTLDTPPKTDPCRFVLNYWQGLCGDRLRPHRTAIDPAALSRYLPHVGLFEVRSPQLTFCRLAGTAFHASLGFELTGTNVIHLYASDLHRAAGYRFHMMVAQPCAAILELPLRFPGGMEHPHEIVLLPLEPAEPAAPPLLLVGMAPID